MRGNRLRKAITNGFVSRLAARTLRLHPDFRVSRRLPDMDRCSSRNRLSDERTICVLDAVTTGPDAGQGAILALTLQLVIVGPSGLIVETGRRRSWLEDPGTDIPISVSEASGITAVDVVGRTINDGEAYAMIATSDLVVGHDIMAVRSLIERRLYLPVRRWICSRDRIPWQSRGFDRTGLEDLLLAWGWFYDVKDPHARINALLHLLDGRLDDERTVLCAMLEEAPEPTVMVEALPFDESAQFVLLTRGYRMLSDQRRWGRAVCPEQVEAERSWLTQRVYRGARRLVAVSRLDRRPDDGQP